MRPRFITFEGLDGSGKSTHLRTAAGWLRDAGEDVVETKEPGGTPLGDALRSAFLDPRWAVADGTVELLVVFASRRQHLEELIGPALAAGKTVLCDRFTDSTYAYQGYGRGVALETIAAVDRLATGERRPDLTVLFDLPPAAARGRGHSSSRRRDPGGIDRIDAEELDFYQRVRDGYLTLAGADPERFRIVDSSGSRATTEARLKALVDELFGTPHEAAR